MGIKTTDLIANFFKSKGIKQVFGVTGGAAVHLFDSYKKKKIQYYLYSSRTIISFCRMFIF